MEYKVLYHPDTAKDVTGIPQNIKTTIEHAIKERLLKDPSAASQPLKRDLKGYRKMRVGDYRVIHKIQGNLIIILKIGHRKEVYDSVFSRLNWRR